MKKAAVIHKGYSVGTLQNMKKKDLIEYIRTMENNHNAAVSFNEQQARNIEAMMKSGEIPMTWLSVKYSLPKPSERVLICLENGFVGEGYLMHKGKWGRYDELGSVEEIFHCSVVGWMPMPESMKGEAE